MLGYTDYFVVCSGNTDRQTKAIHDGIHQGMKKDHGMLPRRVEGLSEARWILMDYLDVIVHVFTPEARDFYRLEQLWGEAPRRAVARSAGEMGRARRARSGAGIEPLTSAASDASPSWLCPSGSRRLALLRWSCSSGASNRLDLIGSQAGQRSHTAADATAPSA